MFDTIQCEASQASRASSMLSSGTLMLLESLILLPTCLNSSGWEKPQCYLPYCTAILDTLYSHVMMFSSAMLFLPWQYPGNVMSNQSQVSESWSLVILVSGSK